MPSPTDNATPTPARKSKKDGKLKWIVLAIGVVALGAGIYILWHWNEESTDDAQIEAHVVTIAPKVSGYVKALNITDNQQVKAGDVLLEIDPADYIIRRDRARAQIASAQAAWDKANSDLKRMQRLTTEARSREQLEAAVAAEEAARAGLENIKADLAQAQIDLGNTKIIAPIDGRITRRGVELGDYVQPGQALGYLVGNDIWVIANFKETQLKHMKVGQRVDIHADAYPDAPLKGHIDSFQKGTGVRFSAFPPENATGNFVKIVQRVPVKIVLDKQPDHSPPLGPGMSVEPTVYTK